MFSAHLLQTVHDAVLAAPEPPPGSTVIDTAGILTWFAQVIAPILLAILGIVFLARSRQGQVSQVVTSSGIAIVGLCFLGGAGALALLGDDFINLIFT